MNIYVLQHASFEDPGLIADWAFEQGHSLHIVPIFSGEAFPPDSEIDFLIVLGGPMSANDSEPWIADERALIARLMMREIPVLGICFGAQQIAKLHGADIVPTPKEVGWGEIDFTAMFDANLSGKYTVLHWHSEGFTLPQGARTICSSKLWKNQGFVLGSGVGLQLHFETDELSLSAMVENDAAFITGSALAQSADDILCADIPNENQVLLYHLLTWMTER